MSEKEKAFLGKFPELVQTLFIKGELEKGHLRALRSLDERGQSELALDIFVEKWSIQEVQHMVANRHFLEAECATFQNPTQARLDRWKNALSDKLDADPDLILNQVYQKPEREMMEHLSL